MMSHLNTFLFVVFVCFLSMSARASNETGLAVFCDLMREDIFCENKKSTSSTKQDSLLRHILNNTSTRLEFKNKSSVSAENRNTGEALSHFSIREQNLIGEYHNKNFDYKVSVGYKTVYRSRDTDTGEELTGVSNMQQRLVLSAHKVWKTSLVNFSVGYKREYHGTENYLENEMIITYRDELKMKVQKVFTIPLVILSLSSDQQFRILDGVDSSRNRFEYKLHARERYLFAYAFIKQQYQYEFKTRMINKKALSIGFDLMKHKGAGNKSLVVTLKREQDFRAASDIWEDAYKAEIIFKLFI